MRFAMGATAINGDSRCAMGTMGVQCGTMGEQMRDNGVEMGDSGGANKEV